MPPGIASGWDPAGDFRLKDRNQEDVELQQAAYVEKGKLADLLLLDASPLDDINNTRKIDAVVFGGKLFPKADLQKMLADLEAAGKKAGEH